jgi:hypothetical protein
MTDPVVSSYPGLESATKDALMEPVDLSGFAALRRWFRCRMFHTAVAEDRVEWKQGELTRSVAAARWCMLCGRTLP